MKVEGVLIRNGMPSLKVKGGDHFSSPQNRKLHSLSLFIMNGRAGDLIAMIVGNLSRSLSSCLIVETNNLARDFINKLD